MGHAPDGFEQIWQRWNLAHWGEREEQTKNKQETIVIVWAKDNGEVLDVGSSNEGKKSINKTSIADKSWR